MSSKAEQVLILDPPSELHFRGTFTSIVTSVLKLNNPTDQRVLFKVKTTAPKQYCVRPNSGIIEAKGKVEVAVMLQPFEYNPNEKNKHKFMVQTMFAPEGEFNQDALWRDASPDSLMDSKLRCVFEAVPDPASNGQTTVESPNMLTSSDTSKNDLQTAPVKSSPKVSNTERRKVTDNEVLIKTENTQQELDGKEAVLRQRQRTSDSVQSSSSRISKVTSGEELSRKTLKQEQQQQPPPTMGAGYHHHSVASSQEDASCMSLLRNLYVQAFIIIALILGIFVGKFLL